MLCYKDMQFCKRDCINFKCERNKRLLPANLQMPVAYGEYLDCEIYKRPKDKRGTTI